MIAGMNVSSVSSKVAFTLAEVLITLGIIGVVAAMTMPTLMTKIKSKQLEVQFKRADSAIIQALTKAASDYADLTLDDLYVPGSALGKNENLFPEFQAMVEELNVYWLQQFNGLTKVDKGDLSTKKIWCYSILGNRLADWNGCYFEAGNAYMLPSGFMISDLSAHNGGINHPKCVFMRFDTNGPYTGPNRYGHDIFMYDSCAQIEYYKGYCNPTLSDSNGEKFCYYNAHTNTNPITSKAGSGYWEILFKPESYWRSGG